MATTAPTHLKYAADYNQQYLSMYDIKDDVIVNKLHKLYGEGLYATDMYDAAGAVEFVPYDENGIIAYEEQAPCATVRTGSEISTGSANGTITFDLHADSKDSNDNPVVRENETIVIPYAYQPSGVFDDREYLITDITAGTVTAKPMQNTSQIATAVPSGTYLRIGATAFAVGDGQPKGKRKGYKTRKFYYRLVKDSLGMEGGAISAKYQEVLNLNGKTGLLSKALVEAEFDLKKQKAFVFMFGEEVSNSGLTATSQFGGTNNILGTKGVYKHAVDRANDYRFSVEPDYADFEYVGLLFEARGVTSKKARIFAGPNFGRGLQRAFKDEIAAYSGGSDLLDSAKQRLGINVQSFVDTNGIEYYILPVQEFADPSGAGLNVGDAYTYQAPNSGLIIPDEMMTMKSFAGQPNKTIPNVTLAYVNYNGENRMNVIGVEKGMSGFESGREVSNQYDGNNYHMMSHMAVVAGEVEKWVLMRNSA